MWPRSICGRVAAESVHMHRKILIGLGLVGAQATIVFMMGQPVVCECGSVKLWEGVVLGPGNSQHVSDWYTPSHIIHGILFYLLLRYALPKSSVPTRLLLAVGIEASWEIFENTPLIIDRYREQALALGYMGDSILNSVSDTIAMIAGFMLASKARVAIAVLLVIALEAFVGYMIRDNLTLNIVQLLMPIDSIAEWQAGN